MDHNRTAVEHRELPPRVAERAESTRESPVRHADWLQQLLGRAPPRHDVRTIAQRLDGEARRLGREARRFGRRLTA